MVMTVVLARPNEVVRERLVPVASVLVCDPRITERGIEEKEMEQK